MGYRYLISEFIYVIFSFYKHIVRDNLNFKLLPSDSRAYVHFCTAYEIALVQPEVHYKKF